MYSRVGPRKSSRKKKYLIGLAVFVFILLILIIALSSGSTDFISMYIFLIILGGWASSVGVQEIPEIFF